METKITRKNISDFSKSIIYWAKMGLVGLIAIVVLSGLGKIFINGDIANAEEVSAAMKIEQLNRELVPLQQALAEKIDGRKNAEEALAAAQAALDTAKQEEESARVAKDNKQAEINAVINPDYAPVLTEGKE